MTLQINYKRPVITALLCLTMALAVFYLSIFKNLVALAPILISVCIPLTNLDRIKTSKKYQAFLLSAFLTPAVFFLSVFAGLAFGKYLGGQMAMIAVSTLSGLLMCLITNLYIRSDNFKLGIGVTSLLACLAPLITQIVIDAAVMGVTIIDRTIGFLVVWHTFVGLGISIGIWARFNKN